MHIYGVDLVKSGDDWIVLEDNLRIPSGITYQMKPRGLFAEAFPELAEDYDVEPYDIRDTYHELFRSISGLDNPVTVLLTDGKYGAAFFEHRYLSEMLGIPIVEGSDLHRAPDGHIRVQTLDGDIPVDVIYLRVEDLDMFTPGLMQSYLDGKVILINAMGTGAADDKLVYTFVPDIIRHYLGEEPILKQAPSYNLLDPEQRLHVLGNLDKLVLKTRAGYGGLGVFVMPDLGDVYRASAARRIMEDPEAFIAQETLDFSKHMILDAETQTLEERFIDLRVFSMQDGNGKVTVPPGGLTRVSSPKSRITNNSSGGLCKPTWVLR
ncbi:MAG: circularly permuted type 2 ATP-grasp protein [Chloroflexi bacterium]|nr:circularly permuted type 2 ATP-grasp protein [Chloroflexota bacterium]